MKGQWSQYFRLVGLGIVAVLFVHLVVAPFVNHHFSNWLGYKAGAAAQQRSVSEVRDPGSSPDSPPAPVRVSVNGQDAVQDALTQAWSYLASRQYDKTTHERICQDLFKAYKTRGLPAASNGSLLATIQLVNDVGVAHTIDEANNLLSADAVRLINTFTSHGHLLTKNQRARLKRASARASQRKSAA